MRPSHTDDRQMPLSWRASCVLFDIPWREAQHLWRAIARSTHWRAQQVRHQLLFFDGLLPNKPTAAQRGLVEDRARHLWAQVMPPAALVALLETLVQEGAVSRGEANAVQERILRLTDATGAWRTSTGAARGNSTAQRGPARRRSVAVPARSH